MQTRIQKEFILLIFEHQKVLQMVVEYYIYHITNRIRLVLNRLFINY